MPAVPAVLNLALRPVLAAVVVAAPLLAAAPSVFAADSTPSRPTAVAAPKDNLADARRFIAAKQWPAALEALQRANDTGSADWNNLMGYTARKGATPDLAAAEKYYDEALRIDPKHRGALEYSGELYLMKGDLAKAEQRLSTLEKACGGGCEEAKDLKQAIQKFKMAGNRYVAG